MSLVVILFLYIMSQKQLYTGKVYIIIIIYH